MSEALQFLVSPCPLGGLLVAGGPAGLRALRFGDDPRALARAFGAERPGSRAASGSRAGLLAEWLERLLDALDGSEAAAPPPELPLDWADATPFQRAVWRALQAIPPGETRSYGAVAGGLGRPTAARAVARACASNPIAWLVPCHRVVAASGRPAGYRWGLERQAWLLRREAAGTGSPGGRPRSSWLPGGPVATALSARPG